MSDQEPAATEDLDTREVIYIPGSDISEKQVDLYNSLSNEVTFIHAIEKLFTSQDKIKALLPKAPRFVGTFKQFKIDTYLTFNSISHEMFGKTSKLTADIDIDNLRSKKDLKLKGIGSDVDGPGESGGKGKKKQ